MVQIYDLMNKGEENLTEKDVKKLTSMTNAAEKFEDEVFKLE